VPHIRPDEDPHSDITELNDEDNDEDDKSDTEDDAVVDSRRFTRLFLLSIGMFWRRNRMKLLIYDSTW
jgi:hypothetical protein